MEIEEILAMAVACVAEESGVDPKHVIVRSFREIPKSSLQQYIEENKISYRKYQLEDSRA